ncbi:DUF4320 family protein [Anaeromicropila populeti]|uniref:Uncharacterized protein n=1 Tax=Anaeromicropila populeti TaxID=37658 RepID=A0A1I6JFU3_9FIRM|nr:DUF4320 family protein [Anaeromicropila populeti]SFR77729.1 protein of unknown function [Anaeromicropila populeti]
MRVKKKLMEQEGAAMIEICIGVLVAGMILTLILQTISVMIYRYQMGTFADKVGEIISVSGKYDSEVQEVVKEYVESTNLQNVAISLEGTEYMEGTEKIQLNSCIRITVSASYQIGFDFANVPISLRNVSQTRSDVYWK